MTSPEWMTRLARAAEGSKRVVKGEDASEGQVNYIRTLIRTRVMNDQTKEALLAELDEGMSKHRAHTLIDTMSKLPWKRKR